MSGKNPNGAGFGFDAVKNFDKHISVSVLGYSLLMEMLKPIATNFITADSNVYDLGCSTGNTIKELARRIKANNVTYIGYDISENLLPKSSGNLHFYKQDITQPEIQFNNTNFILSSFTMQFLKPDRRPALLKRIYDSLGTRGAFVLLEKVYAADGHIQDIFTFSHYDYKLRAFSAEDILGKQGRLREIMKPLSSQENEELLVKAGFSPEKITPFYQCLNFKGWLCIK